MDEETKRGIHRFPSAILDALLVNDRPPKQRAKRSADTTEKTDVSPLTLDLIATPVRRLYLGLQARLKALSDGAAARIRAIHHFSSAIINAFIASVQFFKSTVHSRLENVNQGIVEHVASDEAAEASFRISNAVNIQIDFLMFFDGKLKRELISDPYLIRYIYGMFRAPAAGSNTGPPKDRPVDGEKFIEYVASEFNLPYDRAGRLLENLNQQSRLGVFVPAFADGELDRGDLLKGLEASRLLYHFDHKLDVAMDYPQISGFRNFHRRQNRALDV